MKKYITLICLLLLEIFRIVAAQNYDPLVRENAHWVVATYTTEVLWNYEDFREYYTSLKTIHIKAYPNPVKDGNITFELQNTEYYQNMVLRCFNVFGELVHEERIYLYQGESIVDLNGWSKGIFIGVVYSNGLPVGNCKFVKH